MSKSFSEQDNRVFDRIIENRRSVRSFKEEAPTDSMIKAVIHAGVCAPYAALAIGDIKDYRRFFVFRKGSSNLSFMNETIKKAVKTNIERLRIETEDQPELKEKSAKYIEMLGRFSQNGFPRLTEIPCFIVVAEYQGMPSAEKQSLAHVMQNMWLKATAMGARLPIGVSHRKFN